MYVALFPCIKKVPGFDSHLDNWTSSRTSKKVLPIWVISGTVIAVSTLPLGMNRYDAPAEHGGFQDAMHGRKKNS